MPETNQKIRKAMKTTVTNVMAALALTAAVGCAGSKPSNQTTTGTEQISTLSWTDLGGEWIIQSVNGKPVPTDMERTPFLAFDVEQQRVHGYAGCNLTNGSIGQEEGKPGSLRFGQMITTMMAGPHLDVEQRILQQLEKVTSFRLTADQLSLTDEAGNEIICLKKNTGASLSR